MKPGDMVQFKGQSRIGLVLSYISYEQRFRDPFPHWHVLFSDNVLSCRESDLEVV